MDDYDGEVIVGTKVDKTGLEKGIKEIEKYDINVVNEEDLEEARNEINQFTEDVKKAVEEKLIKAGYDTQEVMNELDENVSDLNSSIQESFTEQVNLVNSLVNELGELYAAYKDLTSGDIQLSENAEKAEVLKQRIIEIIDSIEELTGKRFIIKGINDAKQQLPDISKGLKKITRDVVRWGLAIFGIRSAYMAVRSAMSIISQQDDQLKADIDYMKNAIAYVLEPAIRWIVNLMRQIMVYTAYIWKAWTGGNLFKNANKSLEKANSQAKALGKTLAGFDEMNLLQDTSTSGGTATPAPSFDLTAPEDIQPPSWLTWIAKNKGLIIDTLESIGLALIGIKVLGLDPILALGLGIAIQGIIDLIKDVKDLIEDPTWKNFGKVLEDLSVILIGVALALMAVDMANPVTGILLLIALITSLSALIIQNWDKIKGTLSKAWQWIKDKFNGLPSWAKTLLKGIGNAVILMINGIIDAINAFLLPLRGAIAVIGKVMGKNWNLNTVAIPRVPYLRKGGIINMPGKGVPIPVAKGGEGGPEGVIPLTDSQQMALLGKAIAENIVINANIINSMNGRIISKELQKIQNEDNFAYNR